MTELALLLRPISWLKVLINWIESNTPEPLAGRHGYCLSVSGRSLQCRNGRLSDGGGQGCYWRPAQGRDDHPPRAADRVAQTDEDERFALQQLPDGEYDGRRLGRVRSNGREPSGCCRDRRTLGSDVIDRSIRAGPRYCRKRR